MRFLNFEYTLIIKYFLNKKNLMSNIKDADTVSQRSHKSIRSHMTEMSYKTTPSIRSVAMNDYTYSHEKNNLKNLHSNYQSYARGKINKEQFKKKLTENGFTISNKFDKASEDPDFKFKNVLSNIEDFKKTTKVDNVRGPCDMNYPRYMKKDTPAESFCQNENLHKLQLLQRGAITEKQFIDAIGNEKDKIKSELRLIRASNEGDFAKIASKLLHKDETALGDLENPLRCNFSQNILEEKQALTDRTNKPGILIICE